MKYFKFLIIFFFISIFLSDLNGQDSILKKKHIQIQTVPPPKLALYLHGIAFAYESGFYSYAGKVYLGWTHTYYFNGDINLKRTLTFDHFVAFNTVKSKLNINNVVSYRFNYVWSLAYSADLYYSESKFNYVNGIGINADIDMISLGLYGYFVNYKNDISPLIGIKLVLRPMYLLLINKP